MKDLYQQLMARADTLDASYTVYAVSHAAHRQAVENMALNPCPQNGHAQMITASAWDSARDMVIRHAQYLLGTLSLVLFSVPHTTHPALWKQTEIVKEAFNAEVQACNRYLNFSGGSTEAREKWQAAQDEIVKVAQPLPGLVRALGRGESHSESLTPTEVDV